MYRIDLSSDDRMSPVFVDEEMGVQIGTWPSQEIDRKLRSLKLDPFADLMANAERGDSLSPTLDLYRYANYDVFSERAFLVMCDMGISKKEFLRIKIKSPREMFLYVFRFGATIPCVSADSEFLHNPKIMGRQFHFFLKRAKFLEPFSHIDRDIFWMSIPGSEVHVGNTFASAKLVEEWQRSGLTGAKFNSVK